MKRLCIGIFWCLLVLVAYSYLVLKRSPLQLTELFASGQKQIFTGNRELFSATWIRSTALSPGGEQIATADSAGSVQLMNLRSGKREHTFRLAHKVKDLFFSNTGAVLVVHCDDGTFHFFDTVFGKKKDVLLKCDGHTWLAYGPDSSRALTYSDPPGIWDLDRSELIRKLGLVSAISPNGFYVAAFSEESKSVQVFDIGSNERFGTNLSYKPEAKWDSWNPRKIVFSVDSKRILTRDGGITHIWDAQSGEILSEHKVTSMTILVGDDGVYRHVRGLYSDPFSRDVTFDPTERIFAIKGGSSVALWDAVSGTELGSLSHYETINGLAFSPDGSRLLTWGRKSYLWDVDSRQQITSLFATPRGPDMYPKWGYTEQRARASPFALSGVFFALVGETKRLNSREDALSLYNSATGRPFVFGENVENQSSFSRSTINPTGIWSGSLQSDDRTLDGAENTFILVEDGSFHLTQAMLNGKKSARGKWTFDPTDGSASMAVTPNSSPERNSISALAFPPLTKPEQRAWLFKRNGSQLVREALLKGGGSARLVLRRKE